MSGRSVRQPLYHERAEHDGERREQDEVAVRERGPPLPLHQLDGNLRRGPGPEVPQRPRPLPELGRDPPLWNDCKRVTRSKRQRPLILGFPCRFAAF